jgi:hypothetical protein
LGEVTESWNEQVANQMRASNETLRWAKQVLSARERRLQSAQKAEGMQENSQVGVNRPIIQEAPCKAQGKPHATEMPQGVRQHIGGNAVLQSARRDQVALPRMHCMCSMFLSWPGIGVGALRFCTGLTWHTAAFLTFSWGSVNKAMAHSPRSQAAGNLSNTSHVIIDLELAKNWGRVGALSSDWTGMTPSSIAHHFMELFLQKVFRQKFSQLLLMDLLFHGLSFLQDIRPISEIVIYKRVTNRTAMQKLVHESRHPFTCFCCRILHVGVFPEK